MAEQRTFNEERHGYDVVGPCWTCGARIAYFEDEDGTPRDIEPVVEPVDRIQGHELPARFDETAASADRITDALAATARMRSVETAGPERCAYVAEGAADYIDHPFVRSERSPATPRSVETADPPLLDPVLVRAGLRATSLPCNCHPKIVLGEIVEERDDKHVNEFIAGVRAAVPCKHGRMDCPACGRIVILRWPVAATDTTETPG